MALTTDRGTIKQEARESRASWLSRARRLVVICAPVAYVLALGTVVVTWGLPLARDQLFLWLGLGMAAFSVGRERALARLLVEWLPIFGLLVLYDFSRGAVAVAPGLAHQAPQIAFDRAIFGGDVPTVFFQRHLWNPAALRWYDYGVWATYMTHFFVVWGVAAVVWRTAHERFRRYVAVAVLLTLAAFLTYWLFPAQPPWLAGQGGHMAPVDRIVPTVWGRLGVQTVESAYENSDLVNTVAAMPSLHAAYPCMLLLFFWSAGWAVRIGLGFYTLAMGFVLVYGGEHFVLDIVAGWAMAAAAFGLVSWASALVWRRRAAGA